MRAGSEHLLGWTQPILPPLPPGEAQWEPPLEIHGAPAKYPPQTAPGFRAAWDLGLLPPPPPQTAPERLPGMNAGTLMLMGIGMFFGALFLLLTAIPDENCRNKAGRVGSNSLGQTCQVPDGLPGVMFVVLMLAGVAAFGIIYLAIKRTAQESKQGYTTLGGKSGTWRFKRDGTAIEPDRTIPPPGFYPSPYYPGLFQKWDGPGWKPFTKRWRTHPEDWFQWPERPYLDGVPNHPVRDDNPRLDS